MPTDPNDTYERYRWLIEPLKERIPDLEFVVEDYGDTCSVVSPSLNKRWPLTVTGLPSEGMPSWDAIQHFKISEADHAESIDDVAKAFLRLDS